MKFWMIWMLLLIGCGTDPLKKGDNETQEEEAEVKSLSLSGYVLSAFDLTVDDQKYADSEDFYTAQIDKVRAEMDADGLQDYDLSIEAEVGLHDLKRGMKVFVIPEDKFGFTSEVLVRSDGTFKASFPSEADGDQYRIRANKRTQIRLTSEDNQILWCYNFAAVERSIAVAEGLKPIILDTFVTRLTKYECVGGEDSQSFGIPDNFKPDEPEEEAEPQAEPKQEESEPEKPEEPRVGCLPGVPAFTEETADPNLGYKPEDFCGYQSEKETE